MQLQALTYGRDLQATRLYLVRHGQVADGHTQVYHGHNDIELSPRGLRQFEEVAYHLQEVTLDGVYASDRSRALQGAEIICRGRQQQVEAVSEFRELHFGVWEGLSFTQIMEQYPQELQHRLSDLANYRIPGGESLADVQSRVLPKLGELQERHAGKQFLIVGHAGINRVILCQALGLPLQHIFHLDQVYAGLNVIDYYGDFTMVRLLNGILYQLDD